MALLMLQHGLIHFANLIYLASYSVKNVRVLRWLTIIGIVLLIPYYLTWELWSAAAWNVVFLAINAYRLRGKNEPEVPRHDLRCPQPHGGWCQRAVRSQQEAQ